MIGAFRRPTDSNDSPFLNRAALASLRHLRFSPDARVRPDGNVTGQHRSRRVGGDADFSDFRPYAPGDDLRRLDWQVFARSGRPFIRRHEDEAACRVTLMIDASRSMDFNAGKGLTKLTYAQHVAAALAEIVLDQHDEVGLSIAGDRDDADLPCARSAKHRTAIQASIRSIQPSPRTTITAALRRLPVASRAIGTLVVISDFLVDDLGLTLAEIRALQASRWSIMLLHLVHPAERWLPEGITCRFEGLEGEDSVTCSPASVEREYANKFETHVTTLRRLALAAGCDHRRVSVSVPWIETVRSYLVPRGR